MFLWGISLDMLSPTTNICTNSFQITSFCMIYMLGTDNFVPTTKGVPGPHTHTHTQIFFFFSSFLLASSNKPEIAQLSKRALLVIKLMFAGPPVRPALTPALTSLYQHGINAGFQQGVYYEYCWRWN